jgi:hypothetical protein
MYNRTLTKTNSPRSLPSLANKEYDKMTREQKHYTGKEIVKLKHLQKLDLKDGDVIVVQPNHPITSDQAKIIQGSINNMIKLSGLNVQAWLLPADWRLSVVREPKVKVIN